MMKLLVRGVHPPLRPWCISPLFKISPLFSSDSKIFKILPFPGKFLDFYPPKFLMTFFSHRPQISNSPLFFLFQYICPPVSRKLFFPPYFEKFPPCFRQIHLLFTYFTCISFPLLWPWCIYASPANAPIVPWTPLILRIAYKRHESSTKIWFLPIIISSITYLLNTANRAS